MRWAYAACFALLLALSCSPSAYSQEALPPAAPSAAFSQAVDEVVAWGLEAGQAARAGRILSLLEASEGEHGARYARLARESLELKAALSASRESLERASASLGLMGRRLARAETASVLAWVAVAAVELARALGR